MDRCGCVLDGRIERPKVELFLDSPNEALGIRDMRLLLDPTAAGFDYRANGQSRLGPFTSNGRILLPKGRPRRSSSIAALDVAGTTARAATCGPIRAASPARSTSPAAGSTGRSASRPVGGDQQIEAHLHGEQRALAGPPRSACEPGASTGRHPAPRGGRRSTESIDARGLQTERHLARAADRQRQAGQWHGRRSAPRWPARRGAAFELVTLANVRPDRISVTGRGAGRAAAADPRQRGRADAVAATAGRSRRPRSLWRRARHAFRAQRLPAGSSRRHRRPCRCSCSTSAGPSLGLGGIASGRLDYRWEGSRSGRADLQDPRPQPRRAGAGVEADRRRPRRRVLTGGQAAMRAVAVSDGKTIGRAQARFAPLGRGPTVAELMNAPMFAQLRYAGPADTLWRLSGSRGVRPVRPDRDRRRHQRPAGRSAHPRLAAGRRRADRKRGHRHGGRAASGQTAASRVAAGASAGIAGRRRAAGSIAGSGLGRFLGRRGGARPQFQRAARRSCSTATTSPRRSPGRSRSARAARVARSAATCGSNSGRFTLGRASAAASVPQLAGAASSGWTPTR